jgi:hypothetical protein
LVKLLAGVFGKATIPFGREKVSKRKGKEKVSGKGVEKEKENVSKGKGVGQYCHISAGGAGCGMARKLRVEYPGAIYHLMNRDRRESIFKDDEDRQRFLGTLGEACVKQGGLAGACVLSDARRSGERDEEFKPVRRGWFLGDKQFRKELLAEMAELETARATLR